MRSAFYEHHGSSTKSLADSSLTDIELKAYDDDDFKEDEEAVVHLQPDAEKALMDIEHNIVGWDGLDDPENPKNWPSKQRYRALMIIASMGFVIPLASSMVSPGVLIMNREFKNKNLELTTFVISVNVLGWAFGPLLFAPLSDIFGRRRVLDFANINFVIWQIGCALAPNIYSLVVFRFLVGIGGAGCLTLGGGTITDLFTTRESGAASALFAMGPLFGPVIGPIAGGFLAQRLGWRYAYWTLLAFGGFITAISTTFGRETHPAVLLERKAQFLRKSTGNTALVNYYYRHHPERTRKDHFLISFKRPIKMISQSPICAIMCVYMSIMYGILYLLFTSMPIVFHERYGWNPEKTGLSYLGIGIGLLLGLIIIGKTSDSILVKLAAANGGIAEPEMRLSMSAGFVALLPIGLFWYGWTVEKHTHWIVPILGMVVIGFALMGAFVPIQTYMIDAFSAHSAAAIAALTSTRSIVGAVLPLAGAKMYTKLGNGWGNSLLAFVALAMIPPMWWLYKRGGLLRKRNPVMLD
ncbi:synaptic vesicle transporter [Pyronema omphalodes]|nr:synaptic vesicle transporter [Pyronema omphalodes]